MFKKPKNISGIGPFACYLWMEKGPNHSDQVALICFDAHVFNLHFFGGEYRKQEISALLHKVDIGQFVNHNAWIDFWSIVPILCCRKG